MSFINPAHLPETGHPVIDRGHVGLATLANDLYLAWQTGQLDRLAPMARDFVATLAEHFAAEERIMAEVGLETASEHCRRHADLLAEFNALIDALHDTTTDLSVEIMVDLFRTAERLVWEHEMVDDQDFWVHFAGQQREPAALAAWGPHVALGDADMDEQHRSLFALINDLNAGLVTGLGRETLLGRLTALRRFTARHFTWEESLMAATPGAADDAHVAAHAALLAELDRVLEDMKAERYDSVEGLLSSYVSHWLLDHIATMDRKLTEAVAAERRRACA